jgi:hypothetical protein
MKNIFIVLATLFLTEVCAAKTFYLKIKANDNIILDAIDYPFNGYTQVEINLGAGESLPVGINSGCYRLVNGSYVKDQELFDQIYSQ